MSDAIPFDLLLRLLRQHEAANAAFDAAIAIEADESTRDQLFKECSRTMHQILERMPGVSTTEGALEQIPVDFTHSQRA
jgi:hypothetical protein